MLENLPIINREAVDSISEHGLEPPTPEELNRILDQVREHNPLLVKAVVNAGVDNTLELYSSLYMNTDHSLTRLCAIISSGACWWS